MNVQIYLAKSEDLENILKLQKSSIKLLSSKVYNFRQIESLVRSQKSGRLRHSEIIFVAYSCNKLVGFASLLIYSPRISGIFVHPDFTRLGIGRKLIEMIENTAIEKHYRTLYVMSSLSAIDFYQAVGYQKGWKFGFWSEGITWVPCVNMYKQLIPLTEKEKRTRQIIIFIFGLVIVAFILTQLAF